jgi:Zn-dependent peptidase ImmA (M78 family)
LKAAQALTGPIAANNIHKWMRAWHRDDMPDAIDLELVRQMLPDTPYGQGVREIKAPIAHGLASCEGMLVRNPNDDAEWGIFYNGKAPAERQRFTIAHELGHFVLHRGQRPSFNCDKESVYSGADRMRSIEREADDFASNLLMPGDLLRDAISDCRIDLHVLSALAKRFQVSFESLCIRFIKFTPQRAILVYWDNGFAKYEWRSSSAIKTGEPQEPLPETLAADPEIAQEWNGIDMPADVWCPEESPDITLTEFKHTYGARDRVLSLLLLESAAPRSWDRWSYDEGITDSFSQY